MSTLLKKFSNSLRTEGVFKTAGKVVSYPVHSLRQRNFIKNVLPNQSTEDKFTWIYSTNHWHSNESASGAGSTLEYTENLRKELPKLFASLSIKTVFDAPCGDFNWMQHLLPRVDVEYIGGDIVRPMIESHSEKYKNDKVSFIHINLIEDSFPKADLMICRDCLFHLSFADTKSVLKNFVDSGIPYLLTTTHTQPDIENRNILTGDFRLIDLLSAPYNFPAAPLFRIDDWMAPEPERQMCLWTRDQVSTALSTYN
ncbi:class I SAM-dependent methyltransferase [Massilia sp. R2A-15]|uniref:class I SAM-dependent methyltransferase n=1 Tax=Massilia sp. R2A-15 TaxID=3064278 RepID=UPI002733818A|nr:class I SAM-dependent methyltransferase [Massilia sp. R2A-15]WLI88051.1 class I SAM-dependent methyltransferase [Massilia sp. R2A-15]